MFSFLPLAARVSQTINLVLAVHGRANKAGHSSQRELFHVRACLRDAEENFEPTPCAIVVCQN